MLKNKLNEEIILNQEKYKVLCELGHGGNGSVFLIQSVGCNDKYAVKILKSQPYGYMADRFKAEIKFCVEDNHENIIKVIDHGVVEIELKKKEKKMFYIMPVYDKTLRDIMESKKDYNELLSLFLQLCYAVKYIHDKEISHRDIKPENIFVSKDNKVVLADFGIAHFKNNKLTNNGFIGNKSYSSPEQRINNNSKNVSFPSDIYALGCILNEIFTGKIPSGSENDKIQYAYPMLSRLDDLVDRCLLQDPNKRAKIDEVISELISITDDLDDNLAWLFDILRRDKDLDEEKTEILNIACEDIYASKYILEKVPLNDMKNYYFNYHGTISYKLGEKLRNVLYLKLLYKKCLHKFNHEACLYEGLLQSEKELHFCKRDENLITSFKKVLDNCNTPKDFDYLKGRILKLFLSCYDYHCREILDCLQDVEEELNFYDNGPILFIIKVLKEYFSEEEIAFIELDNDIMIDWDKSYYDSEKFPSVLESTIKPWDSILGKFKIEFNVAIVPLENEKYSIRFMDKAKFKEFKKKVKYFINNPGRLYKEDYEKLIFQAKEIQNIIYVEDYDTFDIESPLKNVLETG